MHCSGPRSRDGDSDGPGIVRKGADSEEIGVIVGALQALFRGEFGHRLRPCDGVSCEAEAAFNQLAERLERTTHELARVTRVVDRHGDSVSQARPDGGGGWEQVSETVGVLLAMLGASTRTEELLRQTQSLAQRLEVKASQLAEQNRAVEQKNREVERARRAVEEQAAWLARSSKYKSEFLANMSHELRTPLNSLLILARTLSDNGPKNLTSKQVDYARTIYESGSDLLHLINDVLDLSKVEAGKIEVYETDVAMSDLAKQVDQTFRPMAVHKGLDFVVDLDGDAPMSIRTDAQRLLQVLRNLLGNAFKFTEKGGVRLHVHRPSVCVSIDGAPLTERPDRIIAFSVIDTGTGIPKEKQQLIFEAFQQADRTTSRKYGGTGLGLSISRELSRLLGGELKVESEVGRGSIFTLYLPSVYDVAPLTRTASTSIRSGPTRPRLRPTHGSEIFEGKRVLVVDDDVRNIYALSSVLEEAGLVVVSAENGRAALEVLRRTSDIGIVLMDVMMPEMDGYETMRQLRRMPEYASLPVLALTARAMKGDREKCLAAGVNDYVTKPVDPEHLLSLMRVWLCSNGCS